MERQHVTYLFRLGQRVRYLNPHGPLYTICARIVAEGEWQTTYTALPPRPREPDPQYVYRVVDPANILIDFWCHQQDLYRA